MIFTEEQLQMNTNPFSILDNATYLTQSENQIHPQMIPVMESSRLQSYIIDFNGIRQLSESTGFDYIDSIVLVSEEEGIDPSSEVCIAVDEAELIESPELANLGPIVVRPLSENDMVYLQTKLITDSYLESENLEDLDAILSLNEVEATPVVHSRTRYQDFFTSLAARPKDMDEKQGVELRSAIIKLRQHMKFEPGLERDRNPLVHFKWKGQKYIGKLGYFENLLANATGLSDNERASVSNKMEESHGRGLHGFLGFRYKGNEPPTTSGSTLLRMYNKTVGRIFESPSASSLKTSTIDVPKTKETPPPLIDLDTLFSSEKSKETKEPEPEPKVDNTDHKSFLSHSSLSPVTTLERIKIAVPRIGLGLLAGTAAGITGYKILQAYRNQPKSVIGKKIAALRHIYQNWMKKAASCRDSGLVAKLKRGAARILQLIDRLMSFLQKKAG